MYRKEPDMYSESVKAGGRDFIVIIAIFLLCLPVIYIIKYFAHNLLLRDILIFSVVGYIAYITLVGYCSVFTYSIDENALSLSRTISHRNKSVIINKSDILGIYFNKPQGTHKAGKFCRSFKRHGLCYITYASGSEKKTAVFELSGTFSAKMSELNYN